MKHRASMGWLLGIVLGCSSVTPSDGEGAGGPGGGAGNGAGGSSDGPSRVPEDAAPVTVELRSAPLDEIRQGLDVAKARSAPELLAAHPVAFQQALGYDPLTAAGLELVQSSTFEMTDAELARFAENGFVILPRVRYPSMPFGYVDVYAADLPVFVSADMVLEAVHRSFDAILWRVEVALIVPKLERLLASMRTRLAESAASLPADAAQDADLFLGVAESLLTGAAVTPVTGLAASAIEEQYEAALAAAGQATVTLFGVPRIVDYSQFEPRGHYEDIEALQRYFRAMMWLGRTDFRLIETLGDGRQVFRRRQVEAALALRTLMSSEALADWRAIDRAIGAFVGEHDSMVVPELDQLLADLGRTLEAGIDGVPDADIAQAIVDESYGAQRIASQIIVKAPGAPSPLPLDAAFALFGQRYTVDSHVFSNVVYDRVANRVLPDPLDAAFAALGNDQAVHLLEPQLTEYGYAGALSSMRTLIDAHPPEYWQGSLYTRWLAALRTLSPNAPGSALAGEGLPSVARREAWGRRILATQLASWAELRHDTLLYAKQSYTASSACEFPDAYVEPYPELFWALARYAELGRSLVSELGWADENPTLAASIAAYFDNTASIVTTLGEMAEAQRTGMPHSAEHLTFINQAIRVEAGGSGPPLQSGWYKDLYFDLEGALDLDPTIADVHTDPGGQIPPRGASVLHVGTGLPRPMVVSVDTCVGPRAYVGVVSAYHEHLAQGLVRLTDSEWLEQHVLDAPEVPWLEPVLGAAATGDAPRYPFSN